MPESTAPITNPKLQTRRVDSRWTSADKIDSLQPHTYTKMQNLSQTTYTMLPRTPTPFHEETDSESPLAPPHHQPHPSIPTSPSHSFNPTPYTNIPIPSHSSPTAHPSIHTYQQPHPLTKNHIPSSKNDTSPSPSQRYFYSSPILILSYPSTHLPIYPFTYLSIHPPIIAISIQYH